MSDAQSGLDPRQGLENRLSGLYHLLQRFEGLQQQESAAYQRHAHLYAPFKKKWGAGMFWLFAIGLTMVLSIVAMMIFTTTVTNLSSSGTPSDQQLMSQLPVLVVFLLPLPVALIASGVIVGVRNSRLASANAQIEAGHQATSAQIAELVAPEIAAIDAQLADVGREYTTHYRGLFPEDHLNTEYVGACWQLVHGHRADSVKEALVQYDNVLHQQRVENNQAYLLAEQQRATRVAQMNGIISATLTGAAIGTMRAEGAATRAAMNAPRTVRVEHRWK